MKKTLVALAAIAATSAFAQSSVTMYGLIDINYGSTKTTARDGSYSYKTTGLGENVTAGSRLGFRGTEDLGGGMKAGFVIETGISPTTGNLFGNRYGASGHSELAISGTACALGANPALCGLPTNAYAGGSGFAMAGSSQNRQSYLSLSKADLGEVRIGYQYTVAYQLATLNGYAAGWEGASGADTAHLWGMAGVGADGRSYNLIGGTRADGLTYISPVFAGGFKATVQYGTGLTLVDGWTGVATASPATTISDSAGSEISARRVGALLDYGNGPFKASVAYTNLKNKNTLVGAAADTTRKLWQVGASYDFGVASVMGTYNNGKDGAVVESTLKSYQLGVKVPFGAASAFIGHGKATRNKSGADTADVKQTQVGADYAFSKRTKAYFVSGRTCDTGTAITAGMESKGTTNRIGMVHTF